MKKLVLATAIIAIFTGCGNTPETNGHSTPIDSTNVNGTAPATYGGHRPAEDTEQTNVDDTGTKANNVHNTGTYIKH